MNTSGIRVVAVVISLLAGAVLMIAPGVTQAVPSYARQGEIPCLSCHTIFPALTAYGRQFKLNGYVGNAGQVITSKEAGAKPGEEADILTLGKLPPVSVMMLASWTSTHRMMPDAEHNGDLLLPDQFSFFLAGQISPKAGAFIQVTYDGVNDHFSWDNTDIRAADHASLGGTDLLYGVTLNNNPTVQDVWNSTPAWGYPFAGSAVAPVPAAGTIIDGALGQQVAGITAYSLWNNLLYAEVGAYHAAPIGVSRPLTGSCAAPCVEAGDIAERTVPYWRLALQKQLGEHYLMVGAYGLTAEILPGAGTPLLGETNRYNDIAMDIQYEKPLGKDMLTVHSTWIHERQNRQADFVSGGSTNTIDELNVFRVDGNYYFEHRYGATLGFFNTTGTNDALLYADSTTGSPDSQGEIAEFAYLPWLNTKFAVQYTAYNKFDGARSDYSTVTTRDARDNNSLFVYAWLIF